MKSNQTRRNRNCEPCEKPDVTIRRAEAADIPEITAVYDALHTEEEAGRAVIGWNRQIYPTAATAELGVSLGDMFVAERDGVIIGSARLNREQVPAYKDGAWRYEAPDDEVMVMHTLTISPAMGRSGVGTQFVRFYEQYAREQGCPYLRIDTNERNARARTLYRKLGYTEAGIVPCVFNGIPGVQLVLLEKKI